MNLLTTPTTCAMSGRVATIAYINEPTAGSMTLTSYGPPPDRVSFARIEFISDSIASRQLAASVAFIASRYVVGSPVFVKNKPGEYLSGGCDSHSDRRGMTGLAGSSAIVLRTSELCSSHPVGLIVALLLGFSLGTAPSVLRGFVDCEVDLVCCAGSSEGVCTSENVTLRNSIGRSIAL
jgi:hypothetical protein